MRYVAVFFWFFHIRGNWQSKTLRKLFYNLYRPIERKIKRENSALWDDDHWGFTVIRYGGRHSIRNADMLLQPRTKADPLWNERKQSRDVIKRNKKHPLTETDRDGLKSYQSQFAEQREDPYCSPRQKGFIIELKQRGCLKCILHLVDTPVVFAVPARRRHFRPSFYQIL